MTPSVGRIVHYVAYGTPKGEFPANVCRAALLTEVGRQPTDDMPEELRFHLARECASVCVVNPTGLFFNSNIPHDEETKRPGTWHWPERVE